jgi:hypothetical protein
VQPAGSVALWRDAVLTQRTAAKTRLALPPRAGPVIVLSATIWCCSIGHHPSHGLQPVMLCDHAAYALGET